MEPGRQILLPIDVENPQKNLIKMAFSMANRCDATVVLFIVICNGKLSDINFAQIGDILDDKMETGELQKASYQIVIKKGVPEAEILEYAERNDVQVILMDTREKKEKQQEMIGSITAEVVDGSKVPVIVVPKSWEISDFKEFDKVCIASAMDDFDPITFQNLLEFIGEERNINNKLSIVHILEKGEEVDDFSDYRCDMLQYMVDNDLDIDCDFNIVPMKKSVSSDIISFFKDGGFNVLVIRNNLRFIISRLFRSTITKKLVYHAQTPMIVFPKDERAITKLTTLH